MNVIQSLGWYFPESTGGSEVYVSGLVEELGSIGVSSIIAASLDGGNEHKYKWGSADVYRYPVGLEKTRKQITGEHPHTGFDDFERWLQEQQADIYHQHSWTYGCGLHHLQAAKRQGLGTVLTVHLPGVVCMRGTMLQNGHKPCDGLVEERKCAACWLQSHGMPFGARSVLSRIPSGIGESFRSLGRTGTALAATSLVRRHHEALVQAASAADRVVAVCQWLYDALLLNGVPRQKLVLNRQGISSLPESTSDKREYDAPLVVGFLGRWDPLKGIDVLVKAFSCLPRDFNIELHVHAVEPQAPHARQYMLQVKEWAANDNRIQMHPALKPEDVPGFLHTIDLLAVPSQCSETGPIVVLEAFAAGVPVLGSDLGGIRELVRHGVNGLLVKHDDIAAWTTTLERVASEPELLDQLRSNIEPVRTMHVVAQETKRLYQTILQEELVD